MVDKVENTTKKSVVADGSQERPLNFLSFLEHVPTVVASMSKDAHDYCTSRANAVQSFGGMGLNARRESRELVEAVDRAYS